MIQFAHFSDFEKEEFINWHKICNSYHELRGCPFDWSRQWEYPWILSNVPRDTKYDVADVGGGFSYFPCIAMPYYRSYTVIDKNPLSLNGCITYKPRFISDDILIHKSETQYDIVFCLSVLEHIDNYMLALDNIIDLVKPGGYLAMTLDTYIYNSRSFKMTELPDIINRIKSRLLLVGPESMTYSSDDTYVLSNLKNRNIIRPNMDRNDIVDLCPFGIIAKKPV